jgi:AcrR family transcriptional regulator
MNTESTQSRILNVSAEHLRRLGAIRLRVTAIAEELGMTHANVYRYYPSKLALADAVIAQWLKTVEVSLLETSGAPDPADDKLERMLNQLAHGYRLKLEQDPKLFDVFADAADKDRVIARRHRTRVRELLERVLEEGINSHIFAQIERAKIVAFVFDAAYRFIHPVAIRLDRNAPPQNLSQRREIILSSLVRSLVYMRATK